MTTSGKVAQAVSEVTGSPRGTVQFYLSALQKAGFIGVGGRGRSARPVSVSEAVGLLMASMIAGSAMAAPAALARVTDKGWKAMLEGDRSGVAAGLVQQWRRSDGTEQGSEVRKVRVEYQDREGLHLGWIEVAAADPYELLCDVTRACIEKKIIGYRGDDRFRRLQANAFLDFETEAEVFSLGFGYIEDESLHWRPDYHEATPGIQFVRNIRRLNLAACSYLGSILYAGHSTPADRLK